MNLFTDDDEVYEERRHRSDSTVLRFFSKLFLTLVGLPAMIIGGIHFFAWFMKGHLRVSVISVIALFETLILVLLLKSNLNMSKVFAQGISISSILTVYLSVCVLLGVIGAYLLCLIKAWQFNNNPSLLFMDGWTSNFSYRPTPVAIIKKKLLKKGMEEGAYYSKEAAPLGVLEEPVAYQKHEVDDNKKRLDKLESKIVSREYKEATKQTIVIGETGSGKTVSLLSMMYNDILSGYPLCVIDFKKSPDVLYFLSKWAKDMGRDFYYFANGEDTDKGNPYYYQKATYDPFSSGDQTSLTDTIISLRQWDTASDVYKGRTQSLLSSLLFALLNVDKSKVKSIPWDQGGINRLLAAMDYKVMLDLIQALRSKASTMERTDLHRLKALEEMYSALTSKGTEGKSLREQLEGIKLVCNKLVMSSYGNWLTKGNSQNHIDLLKISSSKNGPIVLFGLSPLEEQEFAKSMGKIIFGDLKRAANTKNEMGDKKYFGVYVDEFQTIDPNDATDLLEKARSAGYFCTLASQSLEKISQASPTNGEATLNSILDTCGNYLFHAGAQEESAERMAKILGKTIHITRKASTEASTKLFSLNLFNKREGVVNKSATEDWVIPPSSFQNLSSPNERNGYKSEAYFITKFAENDKSKETVFGAQRIQVIAQKEITKGISEDFNNFVKNSAIDRHKKQTGEDISKYGDEFVPRKEYVIEDEVDPDLDELLNTRTQKESNDPLSNSDTRLSDDFMIDDWVIEDIKVESSEKTVPEGLSEENSIIDEIGSVDFTPVSTQSTALKEVVSPIKKPRRKTSFETMTQKKKPVAKEAVANKGKANKTKSGVAKATDSLDKEQRSTTNSFKLPDL